MVGKKCEILGVIEVGKTVHLNTFFQVYPKRQEEEFEEMHLYLRDPEA